MNTQLKEYVQKETALGIPKETIIQNLTTQGGWTSQEIADAFIPVVNSTPNPSLKKRFLSKPTDMRKEAERMITGGLWGIPMSLLWVFTSQLGCGFAGGGCSSNSWNIAVFSYFILNSGLLILSGYLLKNRKKFGIVLPYILIFSIFLSIFFKVNKSNIFFSTIFAGIFGGLFFSLVGIGLIALFGMFYFWSSIIRFFKYRDLWRDWINNSDMEIHETENSTHSDSPQDPLYKIFAKKTIFLSLGVLVLYALTIMYIYGVFISGVDIKLVLLRSRDLLVPAFIIFGVQGGFLLLSRYKTSMYIPIVPLIFQTLLNFLPMVSKLPQGIGMILAIIFQLIVIIPIIYIIFRLVKREKIFPSIPPSKLFNIELILAGVYVLSMILIFSKMKPF